jgi:AcrR family transcriptional regulator
MARTARPPAAVKTRRTQEERSASTRALLLDATIDCLIELGYSATTTTVIAERAGVSRGAQLHHYPTKAELVAAAVEHLATRLGEELREEVGQLPTDEDRISAAIDVLWARYSAPLFHAWLELWVAARTDGDLRAALAPVEKRTRSAIDRQARTMFDGAGAADRYQNVIAMTFCLLQGMALERALTGERRVDRDKREAAMLDTWKHVIADLLRAGATAP